MNDVLDVVRKSLSTSASLGNGNNSVNNNTNTQWLNVISDRSLPSGDINPSVATSHQEEQGWEEDAEHEMFVDMGEGAGVEGDLEMDED